jgi:hypothetical protein
MTYEEVEVKLHVFQTSALDAGEAVSFSLLYTMDRRGGGTTEPS